MDPTLVAQFTAGMAHALRQQQDEQMLRIGRQSDGAQYDNRALGSVMAGVLMGANDPERYASYAAASHVPTSQPWMAPPWVASSGFGTSLPTQPK